MGNFLKQYKVLLTALVLVLLGLHLVSSSIDDPKNAGFFARMVYTIYEPIYKVISYPFAKIGGTVTNLAHISTLTEENRKLEDQVEELTAKLGQYSELALAAERYKSLLELKETRPDLVTYARIIARPSSGEYRIVVIDKGRNDGIQKNMAVITHEGLVGHVAEVAAYASKVMLITDANSSVPATVQRTRANAIVEGISADYCKLTYLQRSDEVAPQDIVVTSGLGGVFPKGIIIGEVSKINKADIGIFQDAHIRTAVPLDRIEEVAVLKTDDLGAQELLP